jgi:hypothetical protein
MLLFSPRRFFEGEDEDEDDDEEDDEEAWGGESWSWSCVSRGPRWPREWPVMEKERADWPVSCSMELFSLLDWESLL